MNLKPRIDTLKKFLDEISLDDRSAFVSSEFCFRLFDATDYSEEELDAMECSEFIRQGQLLLNRIIDVHTNYIDEFRRFILSNPELLKKYSTDLQLTEAEIADDINEKLTKVIQEYLGMYYIKSENHGRDDRLGHIKDLQRRNIEYIEDKSNKDRFAHALNAGRKVEYAIN